MDFVPNAPSRLSAGGLGRLTAALHINQHKRLLQLETALPSATLAVERAEWHESVNGMAEGSAVKAPPLAPLMAVVDCLSSSAQLELQALIGEQTSLRVMLTDGRYRTWHGYVTQASQLGSDGSLTRYRLHLMAFTYFLGLHKDSRVFVQQRADEIVSAVLGAYPQANFRFDLSAEALSAAAVRGTTTQYRESDAAFVARLLFEEAWNWRLEHTDDGEPLSSAKAAKHTLVIFDAMARRPDLGRVRFGKPGARQMSLLGGMAEDTITAIALERQLQPNAVTHAAWDARQLAGVSAETKTVLDQGSVPTLEIYDGRGERRFAQHDAPSCEDSALRKLADARAALDLARHELAVKTLHGESAVRSLQPGADFSLTEHSLFDGQGLTVSGRTDNRFLVLAVHHCAANNLGSEAAQLLQAHELESGSYSNTFTAAPAAATLPPPALRKPHIAGVQTALVV